MRDPFRSLRSRGLTRHYNSQGDPPPESRHTFELRISNQPEETMPQRIERVHQDLANLKQFYNIEFSETRTARLRKYLNEQLTDLKSAPFKSYDQEGRIDYLLLKNYLNRSLKQLDLEAAKTEKTKPLLPFAEGIIGLCEARQKMELMNGKAAAEIVCKVANQISEMETLIKDGKISIDKTSAFRAAKTVDQLQELFKEWFGFFDGYDPMFSWWVTQPYRMVDQALSGIASLIRVQLVGILPGDTDAIVGDPIGRNGLLADLEAEMIPYTPEEIMEIGEKEYEWCEQEMMKAARDLGYNRCLWRKALEDVKNLYVEPGKQPQLIRDLAVEAINFVKENDLVTVPEIAEETWRMFMMSPEAQKTNPFFLGGDSILVSYPTDTMDHPSKLMSMRGNNIHFARATVFHEMIPGHHLQLHMTARHNPHRRLFTTPFWIEGWSLYWEFLLYNHPSFPLTPQNRIGMLFWRMHRCARIIFSLKFHLGLMTPQQCIDFLVEKVGHEYATAEGEVRRSFNGEYTPLYQAGYMLGALQFRALREEMLGEGMDERDFHDEVLRGGQMPVEMLRVLMKGEDVEEEWETGWKFYE